MRSHSSEESEEENRVPNNKDLLHLPTIQKLEAVTNFNRNLSHHLAEDEPPEDSR